MSSKSRLPALTGALLASIPLEFRDDGCSASPDALFGYDLRWACRIHDWWWCTRAHPLGQLTEDWKAAGDHILGVLVRSALPRGLRWIGMVYLRAVRKYAGAFNSCGHDGEKCRHALARPHWMMPNKDLTETTVPTECDGAFDWNCARKVIWGPTALDALRRRTD